MPAQHRHEESQTHHPRNTTQRPHNHLGVHSEEKGRQRVTLTHTAQDTNRGAIVTIMGGIESRIVIDLVQAEPQGASQTQLIQMAHEQVMGNTGKRTLEVHKQDVEASAVRSTTR